ncbi:MAG: MoxR family ATPase [Clostridia bacterium]|nr:MoxR family ATPase [Clostridia bacterium]NCC43963.1 MoxR family ATPase [Clostridia bacterium]
MVIEKSEQIIREVGKVLVGKDEVIEKVLMTIYAGGHILLEDYPGVGKTTLALGFAKTLGLEYKRIQFTSDTMPSDITGFSVLNRATGRFEYKPGAVDCQLFLGDEINRTSPKTQSALLEVMEEGSVTVDGVTHRTKKPFVCIATQNPVGSVGTQPLPDSQLDRFMVRLSIGYPSTKEQVDIIKQRQHHNPLDSVTKVVNAEDILEIQNYLTSIQMSDEVIEYMTKLCEQTRKSPLTELGVSPRGVIALSQLSRARAILKERTYVIPEDVQNIFVDVCAHRMILKPQAKIEGITTEKLLTNILGEVEPPHLGTKTRA